MRIGNIEFNSKAEYMAGLRDSSRIELLKAKADLSSPQEAAAVYRRLKNQPFYFETEVGKQFVRELAKTVRPSERGVGTGIVRRGYQETPEEEERIRAYEESRRLRMAENLQGRKTQETERKNRIPGGKTVQRPAVSSGIRIIGDSVDYERSLASRYAEYENKSAEEKNAAGNVKKKKKKSLTHNLLVLTGIAAAAVLVCCIILELNYRIQNYNSEKKMSELQNSVLRQIDVEDTKQTADDMEKIAMSELSATVLKDAVMTGAEAKDEEAETDNVTAGPPEILPEYRELYEKNPDMIGWIRIPDTVINYPVMQTKEDMEYYLYRDFYKEYDKNGLPFMDARSDILKSTTNYLIYGHCMNSGAMFAALKNYKDEAFYRDHQTVYFDTVYERGEYEVIAVFQSRVAYADEITFRYYNFIQADTQEEFDSFISSVERMAYYDTGKTVEFGDQLLTLSTCDSEIEDGRLVVLARKCTD